MPSSYHELRCLNCGRLFPAHANYCPRCGREARDPSPPPPPPAPPVRPPGPVGKKARKKKDGGCGCGCLVILILIGIGFFYSSSPTPQRTRPVAPTPAPPPSQLRPPRAPDFRSPPIPLLGPIGGSWVSIDSVEQDVADATGRLGFRFHSVAGARITIAGYVHRGDGTPLQTSDAMYSDEMRTAGVATTLTMPRDDVSFTLYLPRHVLGMTSSSQSLWIRPALFENSSRQYICNGTPLQFWPQPLRGPEK